MFRSLMNLLCFLPKFNCVLLFLIYTTFVTYFFIVWSEKRIKLIPRMKVTAYVIDTEGCKIPFFDPLHPDLQEFFGGLDKQIIKCSDRIPLTYQDKGTLKLNRNAIEDFPRLSHCTYQGIRRVLGNDREVKYTQIVAFTQDVNVTEEFVRVYCYDTAGWNIYRNYHAFILPNHDRLRELRQRHQKFKERAAPKEIFNVMMLGIDSLARFNHIYNMPKTREFLLNNLSAIELEGYNKVADNTIVNLTPMLTGNYVSEEVARLNLSTQSFVDDFNFIFKEFSEIGYSTLFAEDYPLSAIFDYSADGFVRNPTDFYLRPFTISMEEDDSVWNHRFCVLNRPEINIILDYALDLQNYPLGVPKFSFTFNTRLTHDYLNSLSTADEHYSGFLQRTLNSGVLNNTILIFYGDHGFRQGAIMQTDFGKAQVRLPLMYFVFPTWFPQKYPVMYNNFLENRRRLTSPFDIHETLKDILNFTGIPRGGGYVNNRGMSLFNKIPETRTCEEAGISRHWCTCKAKEIEGFNINDHIVAEATDLVINYMNQEIADYPQCSRLQLSYLSSVHVSARDLNSYIKYSEIISRKPTEKWRENEPIWIKIVFTTTPGGGEFEATVTDYFMKGKLTLDPESIARINRYGHDGDCLSIGRLRQYCYCASLFFK